MNRVPKDKRRDLWWDWSWNPITGCKNGCWYCYARPLANRFEAIHGGPPWEKPAYHPERNTSEELQQPRPGQRVFVCSMADIFSPGVDRLWVQKIIERVSTRPHVHFIFLTKRPSFYQHYKWPENVWLGTTLDTWETQLDRAVELNWARHYGVKWINAAPALSVPSERLHDVFKPDWVVSEPLHGHGNQRLVKSEANVHAWHSWATSHRVPVWIKGMKHWGVRCPIPHQLPGDRV